jgi:membrane fusion protein, multidrug efflux system
MSSRFARAALVAALSLAIAGLSGCGAEAAPRESAQAKPTADAIEAKPVEVASVTQGDLEPAYASSANIEADHEAKIVAEMPGEVTAVLVEEGMRVAAGQVLARVDAAHSTLQLRQQQSIANRMANDARRNDVLIERSIISRDAYDRARYDRDTQQAAVNLARLSVSKSEIRAPYAGVITRRHVKQGAWLETGAPVFEIADFDTLKARFDVPERVSALIKPGQTVKFTADALPGEQFTATVERVSPIVDRVSGTVAATLEMDNAHGKLRPGLFIRLNVTYDRIAAATLMPKNAVVTDAGPAHVFLVDAGQARRREVSLGLEYGALVQVLTGVSPGSQVITVGQKGLKDGDPVEVLSLEAAKVEATAAL